jgi:hypothetical protein
MRDAKTIFAKSVLIAALSFGLSGCAAIKEMLAPPVSALVAVEPINPTVGLGAGNTPDALDSTSAAEKAAALEAPATSDERSLGKVTVALGSPAETGLWMKSNLVSVPGKGRVMTASGQSLAVDLLPTDGAAFLSFSAFRALELPLTELPDVYVFIE